MTTSSSASHSDDQILAQFIRDLEGADDPEATLNDYVRRYSDRAADYRQLYEMRQALAGSRPETPTSIPKQLGEFRILRRMEVGPMGEIYEAVQERLGRRVVVKVL